MAQQKQKHIYWNTPSFTLILGIIGLVATIVLMTANVSVPVASSTSYDTKKQDLEASISRINQDLQSVNRNLHDTSQYKNTLAEQEKSVQEEIEKTEAILTETRLLVNQLEAQITQNEQELEKHIDEMKALIIQMQKQSQQSPLESILSSKSIGEAISNFYNMSLLQQKADGLRKNIETKTAQLEDERAKQTEVQKQLEDAGFMLRSKRSGLQALLEEYRGREQQYQQLVKQLNEQRLSQEAQIKAVEAERKRATEEAARKAQEETSKNNSSPTNPTPTPTPIISGACWFEETRPLNVPSGYFSRPATGVITRVFGNCDHDAVDLANSIGTELKAIADGVVVRKGFESNGYGFFIMIRHDLPGNQRVYSLYAHLETPSILNISDLVSKNELVGYMGGVGPNAGLSTGPHVHFAMISDSFDQTGSIGCNNGSSKCYNPTKYIRF